MTFQKKHGRLAARGIPAVLAAALVVFVAVQLVRFDSGLRRQQLAAVQQSVHNAVIHCYSLEGSYPPSLDYLAHNYGLILDSRHYIYDYRVFASNVPPEIHVFRKD